MILTMSTGFTVTAFGTELYYLQSRYYNPEWGRFINADSTDYLCYGDYGYISIFTYCENSPINFTDVNGYISDRTNQTLDTVTYSVVRYHIHLLFERAELWVAIMKKHSHIVKISIILSAFVLLIFAMFIIFKRLASPTQICKSLTSDNIAIVEEESFLSGFTVIDNMVYVFCKYTVENRSNEDVCFEFLADMPNDMKNGLIMQSKLIAYEVEKEQFTEINEDSDKAVPIIIDGPVFNLDAHKTQEYYVVYMSKYGGVEVKQDRLLPITSLVEVYQ